MGALELDTHSPKVLFNLIDRNGDGEIISDTFVKGCLSLCGSAKKLEIARLSELTKDVKHCLLALHREVKREKYLVEGMRKSNWSERHDDSHVLVSRAPNISKS